MLIDYDKIATSAQNRIDCLQSLELSSPALRELTRYISGALGRHSWLGTWLGENRPDYKLTEKSIRQARLDWIDWMIASLKGEV